MALASPPIKRGRPALRWLSVEEVAEALEWDTDALHRLLTVTRGDVMPGAIKDDSGAWSVPESALRKLTGAGLLLFSIPRLAELLDCNAETLRRMAKSGTLEVRHIPGIGQRVPWSEYQRLTRRAATK